MTNSKQMRSDHPTQSSSDTSGRTLNRETQLKIGQHLRAIYNDVVAQGVPDRFVELLSRLDGAQAARKDEGDGKEAQECL